MQAPIQLNTRPTIINIRTKPAENTMAFKWLSVQLYYTLFERTEIFSESSLNLQAQDENKLIELFEVCSQLEYSISVNDLPKEMMLRSFIRLQLANKLINQICRKYNLQSQNDCARFLYKIYKFHSANNETIEDFITYDMVINEMSVYLKTHTNKNYQHPDIAAFNKVRRAMWRKHLLLYFNRFMFTLDSDEEKKVRTTISNYISILNKESEGYVAPTKSEIKIIILKFISRTVSPNVGSGPALILLSQDDPVSLDGGRTALTTAEAAVAALSGELEIGGGGELDGGLVGGA